MCAASNNHNYHYKGQIIKKFRKTRGFCNCVQSCTYNVAAKAPFRWVQFLSPTVELTLQEFFFSFLYVFFFSDLLLHQLFFIFFYFPHLRHFSNGVSLTTIT